MEYALMALGYLVPGLFTNFISGFVMPKAQNGSGYFVNLWVVLVWPVYAVTLSGLFGAALRSR